MYPARGSHASYTAAGDHNLASYAVQDEADGLGPVVRPTPVVITDTSPSWVGWRGQWGGSGSSPRGPIEQGSKWSAPDAFHDQAGACEALGAGAASASSARAASDPPAPAIHALLSGGTVNVAYRFRRGANKGRRPRKLLVTVHPKDRGLAPSGQTVGVGLPRGDGLRPDALRRRPLHGAGKLVHEARRT